MASELAIKMEHLPPASDWAVEYDKDTDTLYMRVGKARPATSVDLNGEVWARIDPTTGDVVGFEIEGFRQVFLVRHPEIPRPTSQPVQTTVEKEGWLQAFFAFLKRTPGADGSPPTHGQFLPA